MHPAFCQIESSKPRLSFILKALLQNRTRVLTNSFVNIFKRGTLGAAAILHRSADNPACIGDEIRYDQHTPLVENPFGLRRAKNIGTLRNEMGTEPRHIVGAHHVRPCRWNPYVAIYVQNGIWRQLYTSLVLSQWPTSPLQGDQRADVEPRWVNKRAAGVARGHKNTSLFGKEARRVLADRTKALDGNASALQLKTDEFARHINARCKAKSRGADFVERDASNSVGQSD